MQNFNCFIFIKRFTSSSSKKWIDSLLWNCYPPKLFSIRYDRSSGPGGQNVNKVNSKCTITLNNFSICTWFPEEVRTQLIKNGFRYYYNKSDSIVVQSDTTRSRESNKQLCLDKLTKEIKKTCRYPEKTTDETLERWDKIKKASNEKRIQQKKLDSKRKAHRGKKNFVY